MSRIRRALCSDLKHQRADVSSLDIVNAAMAPRRYHFASERSRNAPARPNPREVFSGKRLDRVIDSIRYFSPTLFEFLCRRIATSKAFGEYALGGSPRMMQGELAVGANGVLAQSRLAAAHPIERDEHLPPLRRHLHAKAGQDRIPIDLIA
jgi:hypothetical protein